MSAQGLGTSDAVAAGRDDESCAAERAAAEDSVWMGRALALARLGLGSVWPNPAVGCVLVKAGAIVGEGWTQAGGRPHAEAVALAVAGDEARGATAYVSLEPCDHWGETPPCTAALITAGVSRVVVATLDPDPRVDGAGVRRLQAQGIDVTVGINRQQANAVNIGFFLRLRKGRPWTSLIDLSDTLSPSSPGTHDALLTDAEHLVAALQATPDGPPLYVVIARDGVASERVIATAAASWGRRFWTVEAEQASGRRVDAAVIEIPRLASGALNLHALLGRLGARGLTRLAIDDRIAEAARLRELGLV